MWFQGSLWELPFPVSAGFSPGPVRSSRMPPSRRIESWFGTYCCRTWGCCSRSCSSPTISLGLSIILGFIVRASSLVGIVFVLQRWLGLYLLPPEWPCLFAFMVIAMGQFIVHAAGRSFGLDAMLRRSGPPATALDRLYGQAS